MNDDVRFRIGADTRNLDGALRNSRRAVDREVDGVAAGFTRMDRSVSGSLGNTRRSLDGLKVAAIAAVAGVALLASRMVAGAREAASYAAAIRDTSDRTGVATEALQELRFAAEQSGNSVEDMDKGLEQLGRRLGEAAAGTGTLLPILEQYGISLTDAEGRTRSVEAVLADVADAMQNTESASERLRIANAAFGRSGVGLVNTLQDGSEGLREQAERARELGAVMSDDLVQRGGDADDQMAALGRTLDVQLKSVLIELTPIITGAGDALVWLANKARSALDAISDAGQRTATTWIETNRLIQDTLAEVQDQTPLGVISDFLFGGDAPGIDDLRPDWLRSPLSGENLASIPLPAGNAIWEAARERVAGDAEAMAALLAQAENAIEIHRRELASADSVDWAASVRQQLADMIATRDAIRAEMDRLGRPGGGGADDGDAGGGGSSRRTTAAREERDQVAELVATMQRRVEMLGIEARAIGMSETAATAYRMAEEALLDLRRQGIVVTAEQEAQIRATAQAYADGEEGIRRYNARQEEAAERAEELDQLLEDVGQTAASSAADAIESWEGVGNAVRGLIADLIRLQSVQAAIGNIFGDLFDGGGFDFGGLFGSALKGGTGVVSGASGIKFKGFAEGGRPPVGVPSIVGERRPEIFVPDQAGTILPNAAMAGAMAGRGGDQYFIDATGADAAAIGRLETVIRAMNGSIEKRSVAAVVDARRRNPSLFS